MIFKKWVILDRIHWPRAKMDPKYWKSNFENKDMFLRSLWQWRRSCLCMQVFVCTVCWCVVWCYVWWFWNNKQSNKLEMLGIEPGASNIQTVRSTTELHPHSTRMGFEAMRAEHNGSAVHRLNHSATSSGALQLVGLILSKGKCYKTLFTDSS